MLFASLALAATAATKWLIVAKIAIAVGTGCLTAAPVVEKLRKEE